MNLKSFLKDVYGALLVFYAIRKHSDAFLFVNEDGEILYANKSAIRMFSQYNNNFDLVNINEIISDGLYQIKMSAKDKRLILVKDKVNSDITLELKASESINGYFISLRDNSRLIALEKKNNQTERNNEDKNKLLSLLEDDIKSPLSSMKGFSQGLLNGLAGELTEKQVKYLKIINTNVISLESLITKLLRYSYIETSLFKPKYEKCDIVDVIKTAIESVKNDFQNKDIPINFDYLALQQHKIVTDADIIKEILKNTLEVSLNSIDCRQINIAALKLNLEQCKLFNLDTRLVNSYIYISILDKSFGLSEDDLEYVDNPYIQIIKNKKEINRAFCLGIVSKLIRKIGGSSNYSSVETEGNNFNIIIPIEKREDE